MKVNIKIEKEVDIKYCQLKVEPRYWEDTTVDGVEDTEGDLIPCRDKDFWCPLIHIDTGVIVNWEIGKTAKVHYKICDSGSYYLLDQYESIILSIEDDYVPNNLIPGEYGDYIIMDINESGTIINWGTKRNLSDFINEEE